MISEGLVAMARRCCTPSGSFDCQFSQRSANMQKASTNRFRQRMFAAALVAVMSASGLGTAAANVDKGATTPNKPLLNKTKTTYLFPGWTDPAMGQAAVYSGRALLRHLQAADKALQTANIVEARSALTASERFARSIQQTMPFIEVVDQIRDVRNVLVGEVRDVAADELLPIYASLDQMALCVPQLTPQSKSKVEQAEKAINKGEKQAAASTLQEVASDISATTVYLPVSAIAAQVNAARKCAGQRKAQCRHSKESGGKRP
jgi:hypothetical protein